MPLLAAVLMALIALAWHPTFEVTALLMLPVGVFIIGIVLNMGELAARQRRAEADRRADMSDAEPLVSTTVPEGYTATPPEPVPAMVEPEWVYADADLAEVVSLDKARADRAEPQVDQAAV